MNSEQNKPQGTEPDPHLDVPSEANRDKHINFRKLEEDSGQFVSFRDKDEIKERRKQWQQGIEEGKEEKSTDNRND
ncbi:MAG TPA: hypothetical protein VFS22_03340 [Flavisolibacter sp.]|nr:hypothetical protein [Flavisolibacter sp.]